MVVISHGLSMMRFRQGGANRGGSDPKMDTQCEWRPIGTAPNDDKAVLLFSPSWDILLVGVRYDGVDAWQQPNGDLIRRPLYWMPLPNPPDNVEKDALS